MPVLTNGYLGSVQSVQNITLTYRGTYIRIYIFKCIIIILVLINVESYKYIVL